jgi:hypothetical protein
MVEGGVFGFPLRLSSAPPTALGAYEVVPQLHVVSQRGDDIKVRVARAGWLSGTVALARYAVVRHHGTVARNYPGIRQENSVLRV